MRPGTRNEHVYRVYVSVTGPRVNSSRGLSRETASIIETFIRREALGYRLADATSLFPFFPMEFPCLTRLRK